MNVTLLIYNTFCIVYTLILYISFCLAWCMSIWTYVIMTEWRQVTHGDKQSLQYNTTVTSSDSSLWTSVMSSEGLASETHLAPYWEGRAWELRVESQLHCRHCSPCCHFHHCCHCRRSEKESLWWSLEEVWDKPKYMTAFDIQSLRSRMSCCHNNVPVTVATHSRFCECVVWAFTHEYWAQIWGAHSHICSYTVSEKQHDDSQGLFERHKEPWSTF